MIVTAWKRSCTTPFLGARPIRSEGVSFYHDYNNDGKKFDYDQKWPCCSRTFPQLTAVYGIRSYLRSAKGINVNLYVPSRVTWQQGSVRVSLTQQTNYPNTGDTAMHLTLSHPERFTFALRVPAWAGGRTKVSVNGKLMDAKLTPSTWAELDRTWKDGDRVELSLDMPLRLVPIDDHHTDSIALLSGPVALFAIDPLPAMVTQQQLLAAQCIGSSSEWGVSTDAGKVRMLHDPDIKDESDRLYQQT